MIFVFLEEREIKVEQTYIFRFVFNGDGYETLTELSSSG